MDNFTKNKLINELNEAVKQFYQAKKKQDKNKIKYYKGFSEALMMVLMELNIVTKNDIQHMMQEYEQKNKYAYRENFEGFKLNDLDSPSIYRKLANKSLIAK